LRNQRKNEEALVKIGIVGAGQIGGALAAILVAAGHDVEVANSRGPETLTDVAADTGATAVSSSDVVRGKDLVVVTIEQYRVPELVEAAIFDGVPAETIVIETNNYYPRERDGRIAAIEDGVTESEWVSEQIGRPVIKVFNNIYFKHLRERGQAAGTPGRIALPVAGDDPEAKRTVLSLVDALGFDAVDAGTLAESWRQQPATPVYGTDLDAPSVREALAAASPERPAAFRAETDTPA
jgi:8-hydroxy-5-deazaflavin:NADPH oxidoreductase